MLYSEKARITRAITAALYSLLLVMLVVTTFWPSPVQDVSVILMLTVKLVPLVPFGNTDLLATIIGQSLAGRP